ncbi:MAG: carboxypeptidase M32 [Rhodothermales bacterium]
MNELRQHFAKIADLNHAAALLEWDQETYMPEGAAESRALQLSTLRSFAHELLTSDRTASLLDSAAPESDMDRDFIRVARRDLEKATCLPSSLVAELAATTGRAKGAWQRARAANRFADFQPHLEKIVDLCLQQAEAYGYVDTPYDALLDLYEPDMRTATVTRTFTDLRARLVPLVQQIAAAPQLDDAPVRGHFPEAAQWAFGLEVAQAFGYDLTRGRQDRSAHPFSTSFSINDSRITTRLETDFFNPAFFGTLHETGHALYEMGVDQDLERTPLAEGTSLGMHESQSRMWENQIGRSLPFWNHYMPRAQAHFPDGLAGVTAEQMYQAANRVEPSLIRVEADEVTYNLHIMLRFELEQDLISGRLNVADLPAAWNDRMEAWLGLRPSNDAEGVLQDIHWSLGAIGYFPTYALGNLMSAQLFDAMAKDLPNRDDLVASGQFAPILAWLREHVHQWGRRKTATQILEDVCGTGLDAEPFVQYVSAKYGALYGLTS